MGVQVYPAGWNAQGRIAGVAEAAPVSHHDAEPASVVQDQAPGQHDEPVEYQADYRANGRPGFLNASPRVQ